MKINKKILYFISISVKYIFWQIFKKIKIYIIRKTTFEFKKKNIYKYIIFISLSVTCISCIIKGFQKKKNVTYRQTYLQTK